MTSSRALATHRSKTREIVLAHSAKNGCVFGSVANGSDTDESDRDILVDTPPGLQTNSFKIQWFATLKSLVKPAKNITRVAPAFVAAHSELAFSFAYNIRNLLAHAY